MNLKPLFEMQKPLDDRIVKEKGLEGQDLLPKKILALQVELGELANVWRGFKFWSNNQEPKRYDEQFNIKTNRFRSYDPLLEEYVDCLHFILSIGLDSPNCVYDWNYTPYHTLNGENIEIQFINIYFAIQLYWRTKDLEQVIEMFLGLGQMLGFTWEQIEQAYMDKNKVNHERQSNGY